MINLLIELVVLGLIFYFVEQIPMDSVFKTGVRVLAIIIVILIVAQAFGVTGLPTLK